MAKFSEYAKDKLARDRNRVIEECARAIDVVADQYRYSDGHATMTGSAILGAADAVRRLKTQLTQ